MLKVMKVVRSIEIDVPNLGDSIAKAIKNDGRSVQVIATYAGISDSTLYNIMKETYGQVSIDTVRSLEKVLNAQLVENFPEVA